MRDSKYLTIRELSRRHGLGWHLVMGLVRSWAERVVQHRRAQRCRVVMVDETSLRRRHRYVTVVLNGESGEVLGMVRHRDAAALTSFFVQQGHRWCRRVEVVVSDGSESYRSAIHAHLGHATHVVDRFHVVRWFAAGLVEVRRRIQRREPKDVKPAFEPNVFRSRFLALRQANRLEEAEQARLEALFATHAELGRAWAMLQELHGLYLAEDEEGAMAALDRFDALYAEDPLPEFYKVVDTLLKWAPEIFAFHRTGRITNGRCEGTNAKLGVLKRMAYGFVNASNFEARGLLLSRPYRGLAHEIAQTPNVRPRTRELYQGLIRVRDWPAISAWVSPLCAPAVDSEGSSEHHRCCPPAGPRGELAIGCPVVPRRWPR